VVAAAIVVDDTANFNFFIRFLIVLINDFLIRVLQQEVWMLFVYIHRTTCGARPILSVVNVLNMVGV